MGEEINWSAFQRYWTPTPGMEQTVVLSDWYQSTKRFGKATDERIVLTFKVLQVDEEVFDPPLEYTTSGGNALKFKYAIDTANKREDQTICVRIICKLDKKIEVVDMNIVNHVLNKLTKQNNKR